MPPFCRRGESGDSEWSEWSEWLSGSASGWGEMMVLWRLWLSRVTSALVSGREAAAEGWRCSLSGLICTVESSPALRSAPLRRARPGASNSPYLSCCCGEQHRYHKLSLVSCIWLFLKAHSLCCKFVCVVVVHDRF